MIKTTMLFSKKDGLQLDIPNADKIEGEIIGTIYAEIERQIGTLLSHGDLMEWQNSDWVVQDLGNRVLSVPVWFPKRFDGKHSDQIQVKIGLIESIEDAKTLIDIIGDTADEHGYTNPIYD